MDSLIYDELQRDMDEIIYNKTILSLDGYHALLTKCVDKNEYAAAVFIYDTIKSNLKPSNITYSILDKLHSKTRQLNNILKTPIKPKSLHPRRRIHKIMKGYYYTEKYNKAIINTPLVKNIMADYPDILHINNRIKMAKAIKNKCNLSLDDIRFIITHLKRKKYFIKL